MTIMIGRNACLLVGLLQLCFTLAVAKCPPACINGACTDGESCSCLPNFEGADCSIPVQNCPDGRKSCWNGSECVRNNERDPVTQKYKYHCDCGKAYDVSAFAGLQCEHSATVSCEKNKMSEYSFCTNGGSCIEEVSNGREHSNCICPPDFDGSHCQYIKGIDLDQEQVEVLGTYRGGSDDGLSGVAIAFIVLISVGVTAAFGLFIWRAQRNRKESPPVSHNDRAGDLKMDQAAEHNDAAEKSEII